MAETHGGAEASMTDKDAGAFITVDEGMGYRLAWRSGIQGSMVDEDMGAVHVAYDKSATF